MIAIRSDPWSLARRAAVLLFVSVVAGSCAGDVECHCLWADSTACADPGQPDGGADSAVEDLWVAPPEVADTPDVPDPEPEIPDPGPDTPDLGPELQEGHNLSWITRNDNDELLSSGVYIYKVEMPERDAYFGKLVIIR